MSTSILHQPPAKPSRAASRGFGMMLIMSFITLILVAMMSMMMMNAGSRPALLSANRDNIAAHKLASFALEQVRADIYSKLSAGTTVDTSYRLPASGWQAVTMPSNPSDLSGSAPIGQPWGNTVSQYWATITQAGGNTYLVQVTAQVGNSTITWSEPMTVSNGYSCAVQGTQVETLIAAGNISSISDADLKAYAQHDCMKKTITSQPSFSTIDTSGTGSNCPNWGGRLSYSAGSGILGLGNIQSDCKVDIYSGASYTKVRAATLDSGWSSGFRYRLQYTGSTPLEFHVANATGGWGMLDANGTDTTGGTHPGMSTGPIYFITNNLDGDLDMGAGDDLISASGTLQPQNWNINMRAGNDTIIANILGSSVQYKYLLLGWGNDKVYIKSTTSIPANIGGQEDDDQIYLGQWVWGNIAGQAGNDLISCTNVMGNGGCQQLGDGMYIYGDEEDNSGTGNDIISFDQIVDADINSSAAPAIGGNTLIYGGGGNNIIYTKGFKNTVNSSYKTDVNASTASGAGTGSLVIVAGNRSKVDITSSGANNVLLLKIGTTSTSANTNVCGAAFNDTPTSCANFARILWY